MKKLTIGLAVLLTGFAANSFAAVSAGTSPFSVCVPSLCGGFNIGVTGLWWRATTPHLDYAVSYPSFDTDAFTLDPFGPFIPTFSDGHYHDVDHDHRWGYKINVGYVFPCSGNDVNLAYTHWDHDEDDHVVRGAGVILPTLTADTLGGTILFPNTITFDVAVTPVTLGDIFAAFGDGLPLGGVPVDRADAHADIKYHAWDLDFGQYVSIGCHTRMRWFGGVRWAEIEHRYNAHYAGAVVDVDVTDEVGETGFLTLDGSINVHRKSDFEGVGPRFGTNVSYSFGGSGFGIVGEASGALLVGENDSHYRTANTYIATLVTTDVDGVVTTEVETVGTTEGYHHPDETRVVPNLEAKLGLDYSFVFCNRSKLSIEAGYMVTHYFNTNDVLSDVGVDAPEFRTRHTVDTSFDGPYVTLQYQM